MVVVMVGIKDSCGSGAGDDDGGCDADGDEDGVVDYGVLCGGGEG